MLVCTKQLRRDMWRMQKAKQNFFRTFPPPLFGDKELLDKRCLILVNDYNGYLQSHKLFVTLLSKVTF